MAKLAELVDSLKSKSEATAQVRQGKEPDISAWHNFDDIGGPVRSDDEAPKTFFDRSEEDAKYREIADKVSEDTATAYREAQEMQRAKLTVDVVSGMERDWRARSKSRVRSLVQNSTVSTVRSVDKGFLDLYITRALETITQR